MFCRSASANIGTTAASAQIPGLMVKAFDSSCASIAWTRFCASIGACVTLRRNASATRMSLRESVPGKPRKRRKDMRSWQASNSTDSLMPYQRAISDIFSAASGTSACTRVLIACIKGASNAQSIRRSICARKCSDVALLDMSMAKVPIVAWAAKFTPNRFHCAAGASLVMIFSARCMRPPFISARRAHLSRSPRNKSSAVSCSA